MAAWRAWARARRGRGDEGKVAVCSSSDSGQESVPRPCGRCRNPARPLGPGSQPLSWSLRCLGEGEAPGSLRTGREGGRPEAAGGPLRLLDRDLPHRDVRGAQSTRPSVQGRWPEPCPPHRTPGAAPLVPPPRTAGRALPPGATVSGAARTPGLVASDPRGPSIMRARCSVPAWGDTVRVRRARSPLLGCLAWRRSQAGPGAGGATPGTGTGRDAEGRRGAHSTGQCPAGVRTRGGGAPDQGTAVQRPWGEESMCPGAVGLGCGQTGGGASSDIPEASRTFRRQQVCSLVSSPGPDGCVQRERLTATPDPEDPWEGNRAPEATEAPGGG